MRFKNATEAFEKLYKEINNNGTVTEDTKAVFNAGFYIENPLDRIINTKFRNFNSEYAEFEWQWYLSGKANASEIAKKAKIWYKCMDENGDVNSNYGFQWNKGNQLNYVVEELKRNKDSRRASISIYDAKDRRNFENDTPCTYAINFRIINDKLNMSVMMRSNDLWYGFCNDQYCFSKLQELVSEKLNIEVGWYFHFVNDIHLYNNFLNKNS
jgi:thymidylate synthase